MDGSRIDEIADGIYRISTWLPHAVGGRGLTINRFLVLAEEPLLYHTGRRADFDEALVAVDRIVPPERLRWLSFGHVEADECGAMNELLAVAPHMEVAFGALGCALSVDDMADRPPRPLAPGEAVDLGGRRVTTIPTPHAPHNQEAQVLFEETTGTLLCGDLFTQLGDDRALTEGDVVGPAIAAEDVFRYSSLAPGMGTAIRGLARLAPRTLALMHGPSFVGDGAAALHALADDYDRRVSGEARAFLAQAA
jgi:flavorubredoxin